MRFQDDELAWLGDTGRFDADLIDYLAAFRFTGDVDAVPEGTVVFPDEPLVRVVAPLPEAQLVETRLINLMNFQTIIASKAARMVLAAPGRLLVDFGLRRAHGADAGLLAARAAYLAGFDGTATLEAERRFGIPAYGTVAHSFIQAHDSEREAFVNFARVQPRNTVLLLDTYDTEAAARLIVDLAPELVKTGTTIRAVRLDSGDLGALARSVRHIFDRAGLGEVQIFASGGIDENVIRGLLSDGAPIDGFGIGTALTTSADKPYLDCAYKLQEYAGLARRKRSAGKATWPGRKQVYRRFCANGRMAEDTLALAEESVEGAPLLRPVMRRGRRIDSAVSLGSIRERVRQHMQALPSHLFELSTYPHYRVEVSTGLRALAAEVDRRTG